MHVEANQWVQNFATDRTIDVIEIGSLNVNGTIRDLFPNARWIGLDRVAGPGVDVVTDAIDYTPMHLVDMVISCEAFEHTPNWREVIQRSFDWLKPGGIMIVTAAGLGRQPHSCDGGDLKPGEDYGNLSPVDLRESLRMFCWSYVRQYQTDVQSFAMK